MAGKRSPHLYLDANIVLDAMYDRWPASTSLLRRIEAEQWRCSTSRFSVLEILDAAQEERWMRLLVEQGFALSQVVRRLGARRSGKERLGSDVLDEIYREIAEAMEAKCSCLEFLQPLAGLWDEAEKICADASISPPDAIHLATAVRVGCDLLVTRDSDFMKLAGDYIAASTPERAEPALKAAGFAV